MKLNCFTFTKLSLFIFIYFCYLIDNKHSKEISFSSCEVFEEIGFTKMAIVNNFLCFDLELGGFVIGIIGLVMSALFMAYGGYLMLTVRDMSKKNLSKISIGWMIYFQFELLWREVKFSFILFIL